MFRNMKNLLLTQGFRCALSQNKCYSTQWIRTLSRVRLLTQNFHLQNISSRSPKRVTTYENLGIRLLTTSNTHYGESDPEKEPEEPVKAVDPSKDRSKTLPVEVSMRYMKSEAYSTTYGDGPVWVKYRRNFKGPYPPRKTRKNCVRNQVISTGNPCPLCRDEYLVLHHRNTDLLKQFISPHTGEVLTAYKTGVCQKKQLELEVAVGKAKHYGLITFEVPFREYDYSEFYPQLQNKNK